MQNGTMLQAFQWELPDDGQHWQRLTRQSFALQRLGVTAMWLPPACKGAGGRGDVGYGVYDLYDLGEFYQKGSIATKYGTKAAYLRLLRSLRAAGIQSLADVVLNHRMGADESEDVTVQRVEPGNRLRTLGELCPARLFTRFTFPGRKGMHDGGVWDHQHFTATDWDELTQSRGIFRLAEKAFAADVDAENGNFDYLMGCDVDVQSPEVRRRLVQWGQWYCRVTGVEGFRLDAVKHISADFYRAWLEELRRAAGQELFAVGEYWHHDVQVMLRYLDAVGESMSLFDVPLHHHLREASSSGGRFDMARMFDNTLVGTRPHAAVTFVDNHDTQPGQSLEGWVEGWFKATAYGLILLRSFGYPCVFWGDLHGIPSRRIGAVSELPLLMKLRRWNALGAEHDYFDHASVIGFTREGERAMPGSGAAFLCTDSSAGWKEMYVGARHAGRVFRCVLGGQPDVRIDGRGNGVFLVRDGGCSVYVPKMTPEEALFRSTLEAKAWLKSILRQEKWRRMDGKRENMDKLVKSQPDAYLCRKVGEKLKIVLKRGLT